MYNELKRAAHLKDLNNNQPQRAFLAETYKTVNIDYRLGAQINNKKNILASIFLRSVISTLELRKKPASHKQRKV